MSSVPAPSQPARAASASEVLAGLFRWVPVRSLAPRHRSRICDHLLALAAEDRYLRFGYPASDEQIRRYAEGIDFERDEVFGIFNRRLELIAMAHLAYAPPAQHATRSAMAEFGVSVSERARGRGYGGRLFDHAVMHARNRGVSELFIYALTENTAMLKIAMKAGATVQRDGAESQAFLKLPSDTLASQVEEVLEAHAAEMNYKLKQHAMRLEQWIDAVAEVKAEIGKRPRAGSQ